MEQSADINRLPDEVIVRILQQLPAIEVLNTALVCKRLFYIANSEKFMNKITFTVKCTNEKVDDEYNCDLAYINCIECLKQSSRNFKHIKFCSLSLTMYSDFIQRGWAVFGANIASLQLKECSVNDIDFVKMLSFCPNLTELRLNDTIHYYKSKSNRVYDKQDFEKCLQTLTKLKIFDLSGNRSFGLSDYFFVNVVGKCANLQELNVSGCKILFHTGIIRRFYFNSSDQWSKPTDYAFTYSVLRHFLTNFGANLKRLNFNRTALTNQSLLDLLSISTLTNLTYLSIEQCKNLTVDVVEDGRTLRPEVKINLNHHYFKKELIMSKCTS
ncbi:F-box/LRR-repeat protein 14-like protein [Dinothrombium tinctorium]|uniref:F-box/LRR-repeat protein 14-like protein n=1 Tax=Dinothrombium tinctorium TaxID=1965070 RepID=A0A443QYZ0_9ACAR|nr:F-box/LRR-repeat protein 14-like protein [Dinothrombium tinctorium]RWS16778.1 F-box/LRR-repeat protein 14-like protein [Dinothrombium tinctorium]RWS16901.1 F-box/LRR-repeat protein 14-like protein [Dinothrombium tinctorium]